ncbi:MAG: glycosyl transferase, partial [Actinomycetota bacterium]|nr:glycosyl transferase [Actinomycetota bacterium]
MTTFDVEVAADCTATPRLLGLPPSPRLLLIASTGGHLAQLFRIAALVGASRDSRWVTFDSPQSRCLLAEYPNVTYLPYVAPRDLRGIVRVTAACRKLARQATFDAAISTGAGVALALPALRAGGLRAIYVESVSRLDGPSMTGRILGRIPSIERRTQHRGWSSQTWPYEFTLLDQFRSERRAADESERPLKVLVTLGTIRPYRFDNALEAIKSQLRPGDEVTWQVGATDGVELPGRVVESMPRAEFTELASQADVVVTHAGVGTILELFDLGIHPVVLPRRSSMG